MIINLDYFLVTVDQKFETETTKSGIITLNGAWVEKLYDNPFEKEKVDNRYQYKRIFGRVEACPRGYSDEILSLIDPGSPEPRAYMSHDMIAAKIKMGHKGLGRHNYCPSGYTHQHKTRRHIGERIDVQRFDRIYFDYRVTEPENLVGEHNGHGLYKVAPEQILCVVRDGEIIMQGGWCFVEPIMETWEEITTKSGIIMKTQPEAKYLQGIIWHIAPKYNIVPGDKILYEVNANWEVKIEGKAFYAIEESDILGKFVAL